MHRFLRTTIAAALLSLPLACNAADRGTFPVPKFDAIKAPGKLQTAVFAGGCFWGTQSVFERVKGVRKTVVGYAGAALVQQAVDAVDTDTAAAGRVNTAGSGL